MRRLLLLTATTCLVVGLSVNAIVALNQESEVNAQELNDSEWYMTGANPQRTSWVAEEVSGNLSVEWYRPIEAYISQNVNLVAANGLIYASTARGLYALRADNGQTAWRFDTELPLGNSPTIYNGVAYVGGYDKKLHALNASDGIHLWSFDGAKAGYDTNPLVVEGKVILGNRDGRMYAIGAHDTPQQGQLIWQYPQASQDPLGPIHLSAAYKDSVVYFASNDMYAYALNASNGTLVWKSEKLPGQQYQSYWPVIFQDKVIFSATYPYRGDEPGIHSITGLDGDPSKPYVVFYQLERDEIFGPNSADGTVLGPTVPDQPWAHGNPVIDASRITEYHESKPWRRVFAVLNLNNGREYTFDSDSDGRPEYIPVAYYGTHSGNRYPPIVGSDNILYQSNIYERLGISRGKVMGWNPNTPSYLSILPNEGAIDEPVAISSGGEIIYYSLCCDRAAVWLNITAPTRPGILWDYDLQDRTPGYNEMWWGGYRQNLEGNYGGRRGSNNLYPNAGKNGIYNAHGDQNPIIPYNGRVYVHRSNAIIAYGSGPSIGKVPLLRINEVQDVIEAPSEVELKARLEKEIQKIVEAGHLKPGYYSIGQFGFPELATYFQNPGETLYTLTRAYPYLSSQLQQQVRAYLQREFQDYFNPVMYSNIGWIDGVQREYMDFPPEVEDSFPNHPKKENAWHTRWKWWYPPHNFYAMWKYVELFPEEAVTAYNLAKDKLQVPPEADDARLTEQTWEHNAYIAGYIGFLNLQELAGMSSTDSQLRTTVTNELNRLLQLRVNNFDKDSPWLISEDEPLHGGGQNAKRNLNLARNFIFLVPELADHLNQHILAEVQEAIDEYNYVGPYWFVSRYNATVREGTMQNLHEHNALFQAKAYILKEPREELTKYLDVSAFARGDLFYIDNLIAAIEAQPSDLVGDLNSDCVVDVADIMLVSSRWSTSVGDDDYNPAYDLDGDGDIDIADIMLVATHFGDTCPATG